MAGGVVCREACVKRIRNYVVQLWFDIAYLPKRKRGEWALDSMKPVYIYDQRGRTTALKKTQIRCDFTDFPNREFYAANYALL